MDKTKLELLMEQQLNLSPDMAAGAALVVTSLIVLIVAIVLYKLVSRGIGVIEKYRHVQPSITYTLRVILRWIAVGLTLAALLQVWGLINNVWTALTAIIALVAIGFVAVWSVLSNVLCSVILLVNRPFRIGEHIHIVGDDVGGEVVEIGLLYTVFREDDGTLIQMPNNMFFQRIVKRRSPIRPAPTPQDSDAR